MTQTFCTRCGKQIELVRIHRCVPVNATPVNTSGGAGDDPQGKRRAYMRDVMRRRRAAAKAGQRAPSTVA